MGGCTNSQIQRRDVVFYGGDSDASGSRPDKEQSRIYLAVTEVNGNVLKEIEDIEDTTETKDIDILKGAQGSNNDCSNVCVRVLKGKFEDSLEKDNM
eukprot:Nk52_evm1s770 gene=Nk52_evmTU1s770